MKISRKNHRKTRSDSVLESTLTSQQAAAFADRIDQGLPLAEAVQHLRDEHGIALSRASISRWAAKRRQDRSEMTITRVLNALTRDLRRAEPGPDEAFHEVNGVLLNRALFEAIQNHHRDGMMQISKIFAEVFGAIAKARRAHTDQRQVDLKRRRLEAQAARNARQVGSSHGAPSPC